MEKIRYKYETALTGLLVISTFIIGYIVYSNLNKGFIFNDEAFYLFFYRDHKTLPTIDATNFYRIFQFLFTEDTHQFRLITYILLNSSTFLLYFFASRYYRLKVHPFLLGFLGIGFNFLTWGMSNIVLHQYIGNTILINISLALIFIYLIYTKLYPLIISGAFLGLVLFNGIPHTIVVVPIALFLLYNFWKKNKKPIIYIVGGGILGIVFYFTCIESISEFIAQFEWIRYYQKFHTKQHPKRFFVFWILKMVGFFIIPASALIGYLIKFSKNKIQHTNYILIALAALSISSFFLYPFIYINYVLLSLLIYRCFLQPEISIEKKTMLIVLASIPLSLSFGSGAYFEVRGPAYNIYYYLTLIIVILSIYNSKVFGIFTAFFLYQCFIFPNLLKDKGWKDFVFTEQTERVKINGYDLYLDKGRKKDIEDLRPYLENQKNVIYSSNHLMGYLYILDAKPPIYYYFALKDYIKFIIEKEGKTPDDYIYIESDDYPFYPKEIVPLKFVNHPERYKTVKTGRFIVYIPSKK